MQVNEETEVRRLRTEKAKALEADAFAAEVDAEQFRKVGDELKAVDHRPGLDEQIDAVVRRAVDLRERADAAHRLAGTSAADYAGDPERGTFIRSRLHSLKVTLIQEHEWAAHPEVYKDNPNQVLEDWLAERRWSIAELQKAIEVFEDRIKDWEAAQPKVIPPESPEQPS